MHYKEDYCTTKLIHFTLFLSIYFSVQAMYVVVNLDVTLNACDVLILLQCDTYCLLNILTSMVHLFATDF